MSPFYNFILLSVLNLWACLWMFNPCSVPLLQRQDCGYPGIHSSTCMMFGKLSIALRNPIMLVQICMFGTFVLTTSMVLFKKSGFPATVGIAYIGIGLLTVFNSTRCCHDNEVPSGPHCYY